jgi:hypothetical protein
MATKSQMAVELDMLRHRIAVLEAELRIAHEQVAVLREAHAVAVAKPAEPKHHVVPQGWYTLCLNGSECYASKDFTHLSQIARNTKLDQPGLRVEVRRVH